MWILKNNLYQETDFPFFHFTTTRVLGNMRDDTVRKKFCIGAGVDFDKLVTLEQTHSNRVEVVSGSQAGKRMSVIDGLITVTRGLPIAMFSADCLPVFLASKKNAAIGMVHAGWQGVAKEIVPEAIRLFKKELGVEPGDVVAAIGPHIQKDCFEVGEDLKNIFHAEKSETHLDLSAVVVGQFNKMGVTKISVCGACTCHQNDLFFSYRKDKSAGRMMSLIRI